MNLTDTQARMLAGAAEHPDRLVAPPLIPPGPRGAIEAKLRGARLIEQIRLEADERPTMAWRHAHGQAVGYRITDTGLASLQAFEPSDAELPASAPTATAEAHEAAAGTWGGTHRARNTPATPPESAARLSRVGLRDAMRAVLAAWDEDRETLAEAIAGLRTAVAGKQPRAPRDPNAPRLPARRHQATAGAGPYAPPRRRDGRTDCRRHRLAAAHRPRVLRRSQERLRSRRS